MAHELATDRRTGRVQMAYVAFEGAPWHGLGTALPDLMTSREAMEVAGLDEPVHSMPMCYRDPVSGEWVPVDGHVCQVHSGTGDQFGIVSDRYRTVQNAEAFAFMDSLVGEGGLRYHTVGAMRGGRSVWMLAQMPGGISVKGVDRVEPFLLFSNAHDGSQAVRAFQTSIRTVCANTARMALERADRAKGARAGWTFRHTGDIAAKLAEARTALGLAREAFAIYGEAADLLAGFRPTAAQLAGYFAELYPDPKGGDGAAARGHRSALMGLFERGRGNDAPAIRHTAWAALNAVTEHVDHEVGNTRASRLESAFWGDGSKLKDRALELAVGLAEGRWVPAATTAAVSMAVATPRASLPAPAPFGDADLN